MKREFSVSSDGSTAASPPGSDYRPSSPEQAQNKTPSATPTKKARSTPASPCKSVPSPTKAQKSLSSAGSTATSVKGRFAEMIIDAGAQAVSKDAVQAEVSIGSAAW